MNIDDLEIDERLTDDDVLVVTVRGELDLYSAPELRALLQREIAAGRLAIVLDLRATAFLDSTALGVIISCMKALRIRGGRLALTSDSLSIAKTLSITGLDHLLVVEPELDAALASLRAA